MRIQFTKSPFFLSFLPPIKTSSVPYPVVGEEDR